MKNIKDIVLEKMSTLGKKYLPNFKTILRTNPDILIGKADEDIREIEVVKIDNANSTIYINVELETGKGYSVHDYTDEYDFVWDSFRYRGENWKNLLPKYFPDTERICYNICTVIRDNQRTGNVINMAHLPQRIHFRVHQELD